MTSMKAASPDPTIQSNPVSLKRMITFFIPLGISASLVTLSHTIIQRTLASAAYPEITIAAYAIALSVFTITERPAVLLRQTCTVLVEDRLGFRALTRLMFYLMFFTLLFGGIIAYTPAGYYLFGGLFNAEEAMLVEITNAYRFLMFVSLFSAIRCLYHGVIIRSMRTKWLTIGMILRLLGMYAVSLYFLAGESPITGATGAMIFLIGMAIEALVSYLEGRTVLRRLPLGDMHSRVVSVRDVLPFYTPLLFSSILAIIIAPAINAMLGKTVNIPLSIASYALAANVANLFTSFFTYTHQIVLNFYKDEPRLVRRFAAVSNFIPSVLIAVLTFTPIGRLFMSGVLGVSGQLLDESLSVLRVFMLYTLIITWVDYCNGLVLLKQQTKFMVWSQAGNVLTTIAVLIALIAIVPYWNGAIGAAAQSVGVVAELGILMVFLLRARRRPQ